MAFISMLRKIVVLTPVKNEAWILPLFLTTTSLWADFIVIADQQSTDGSREIIAQYPKAVLVDNDSLDLEEDYRNKILVDRARELVGTNAIFFRIDADEILTPDFDSEEWTRIKQSKVGTTWCFPWLQIYPGFKSFWVFPHHTYGAFVDDGREYEPHGVIHARTVFLPRPSDEVLFTQKLGILHYQFVDWNRMRSKHRYYQCFEHITFPQKSAIEVFRTYHWMFDRNLPLKALPSRWIDDYKKLGVDLTDFVFENDYWWDNKISEYFKQYSPKHFAHFETYRPGKLLFAKGKGPLDMLLLAYLETTKYISNKKKGVFRKVIRKIDCVLQYKFHL